MTDEQAVLDLLDVVEYGGCAEPQQFFALMRRTFNIAHLLYLEAEPSADGLKVCRLHHTFGTYAADLYHSRGLHRIDPILRLALGGVRPVEWASARRRFPECEPLFEAAEEIGLSTEGVALPLPSPASRMALLAISSNLSPAEWSDYRRRHLRDFQLAANLFHASMLEHSAMPGAMDERDMRLTLRETEVLTWSAAGKSYWEIATILGISERTVRFFMTNARRKLNVVSNTQAVAQAVRHALIPTI
ncbi:helix-turn-helix transcriptional regulator [Sinorhizobium alkalisoli]|uniref:Transcriptional regulator n=1 Tax=Sinorhizobium alkalisoli TaxID=1752398 RepID=A0A1E3VCN6_9HYPH|nr:LuxR C-terminal-related transcriptional regulator [Sinorhizobium alkalisoli]MCA1493554.1 autoinducer binding domain-containing protein [Ensifer sp. NBAIM29]MCG5478771.1 autoinducer binding domain-containing protein [Sinorhizobium alkalisoli]ODR91350.1 transcriptional regulator [Sinorhizobium alkalisoli]QFI66554.1 Transcriptional activator protein LuxR [Sinorhizobium alkalisoli]